MGEYESYKTELVKTRVQSFRDRINNGETLFLYNSIYLPVDSVVVNETSFPEFSIQKLRPLGLDGWNIVGIVPKTLGVALQNSSFGTSMGTTWGAGVGGNIIGVHVLLKKEVSAANGISDEFLENYLKENINVFATEYETKMLSTLHGNRSKEDANKSLDSNALGRFIVQIDLIALHESAEEYYRKAEESMSKNDFDDAILEFTKVIRVASPQEDWYLSAKKELKKMGFSEEDIRHI